MAASTVHLCCNRSAVALGLGLVTLLYGVAYAQSPDAIPPADAWFIQLFREAPWAMAAVACTWLLTRQNGGIPITLEVRLSDKDRDLIEQATRDRG